MRRNIQIAVLLAALPFVNVYASWLEDLDPELTGEAAVQYNDNVSRGTDGSTELDDNIIEFKGSVGAHKELGSGLMLNGHLAIEAAVYDKYDGLNRISPEAGLSISKKFGLGDAGTRARLSLPVTVHLFDDDVRDVTEMAPSIELSKRLHERLLATAGFRFSSVLDEEHPVFATDANEIYVSSAVDITENIFLDLRVGFTSGDVVVHTQSSTPHNMHTTMPQQPSPYATPMPHMYGMPSPTVMNVGNVPVWRDVDTFGPGWSAYKLDADTLSGAIAINWMPCDSAIVTASLERHEIEADAISGIGPSLDYPVTIYELAVSLFF